MVVWKLVWKLSRITAQYLRYVDRIVSCRGNETKEQRNDWKKKKKYIRKIHLDLSRVETILLRFVITSAGGRKRVTARRGRLLSLSLDPTSKKTVSSSRLITVLASKQPALLRDFKGCTGPWWRSNRESLHRRERTERRERRARWKGTAAAIARTFPPVDLFNSLLDGNAEF